jgi:hypothetical protein
VEVIEITQMWLIHNSVIMDFQWMVHQWMLGQIIHTLGIHPLSYEPHMKDSLPGPLSFKQNTPKISYSMKTSN